MPSVRDHFKSSYGAFTARERELERSRARRDARDAARDTGTDRHRPAGAPENPPS